MFEVIIREVIIYPFEIKLVVHKEFESKFDARDCIDKYIDNIVDMTGVNLKKRYESALKRTIAGTMPVPVIRSHPAKGKIIRHVIELKSYTH